MLAAAADCEGAVKQKGCGVISWIYGGAQGLGEREGQGIERGGGGGVGGAGEEKQADGGMEFGFC